eukprot:COSAG04_NODE_455_length_14087_cov_4.673935_7_plen_84_part_00
METVSDPEFAEEHKLCLWCKEPLPVGSHGNRVTHKDEHTRWNPATQKYERCNCTKLRDRFLRLQRKDGGAVESCMAPCVIGRA